MPRFKQPIPLQELTFDSVVKFAVNYCDSLSIKGSLTELRGSVTVIKQYLSDHMPGALFVEFCRRFLYDFYCIGRMRSDQRPDDHNSAALEIIMDIHFVGLICEGDIQCHMDPHHVHRIRGLKILDWAELQHHPLMPRALENYNLKDLTTFIYPRICTDRDLEIIGPRCSKLEILKIQESKDVTDKGLSALSPCSRLRIINIHYCSVSDNGINELLNVHERLEEFNVGNYYTIGEESFDLLSRPIASVCPSVKSFSLKSDPLTNRYLHTIVALFPNLTYLQFCLPFTGDLRILKALKNLTKLEFAYSSGGFRMENLRDLLTHIGVNMTRLSLRANCITRNDLHFISKTCGNLELLYFCYEPTKPVEKLIVPSFKNLKHLESIAHSTWRSGYRIELECSEMLKLEIFRIQDFHGIFEMTEAMMLDHAKFPNLKEVRTFYNRNEITDRINQTAKNNNLDFSLRFFR